MIISPAFDQAEINRAYQGEFDRYAAKIAAVQIDPTLTPDQRAALIKRLRSEQQQAASQAAKDATYTEKQRIKKARERQRPAGANAGGRGRHAKPR